VETYEDCVFGITGGDEMYILALGIVYSKYPDKNIQIHKFNLSNNSVYDCDMDGNTIYRDPPTLSIDDNVRIYGGEVVYGGVDEDGVTYRWDLNPEFLKDVDLIWEVCRKSPRIWNIQISIFEAAEKVGTHLNPLTTVATKAQIEEYLAEKNKESYRSSEETVRALMQKGLLTAFSEDETSLSVSYKDAQVRKCLTLAGRALEMKIYVIAKSVCEKNGEPVYNDALNGVVIDWDGISHDKDTEFIFDTENEIDVMLMHHAVPVFISCKNGFVNSEELYKLETVAERFGGEYAKKILVTASLDFLKDAGKYLRQRAIDMGILLIENVQNLEDDQIAQSVRTLWDAKVPSVLLKQEGN